MKFLFEFVSCCGCTKPSPRLPLPVKENDEKRGLVRKLQGYQRKRARGRSGSVSDVEWKPSLGSISEDCEFPEKRDERTAVGKRRINRVGSRGGGDSRISSEGYRREPYTAFPAFSPTPFMF